MGWWDLFLKLLVRESPQDFVDWLFPGARFVRWRDGQFQKRGRGRSRKTLFAHEIRADCLMEVEYEGQHFLIHVEFQSTKDEEIGYRLLGYSHGAIGLHKLSVSSYVIYVMHVFAPPCSPYTRDVPVKGRRITFDYESIELAEMPVEELEQKHRVGLTPLLLLAKGERPAQYWSGPADQKCWPCCAYWCCERFRTTRRWSSGFNGGLSSCMIS